MVLASVLASEIANDVIVFSHHHLRHFHSETTIVIVVAIAIIIIAHIVIITVIIIVVVAIDIGMGMVVAIAHVNVLAFAEIVNDIGIVGAATGAATGNVAEPRAPVVVQRGVAPRWRRPGRSEAAPGRPGSTPTTTTIAKGAHALAR